MNTYYIIIMVKYTYVYTFIFHLQNYVYFKKKGFT